MKYKTNNIILFRLNTINSLNFYKGISKIKKFSWVWW